MADTETYYTPARIRSLLCRWAELLELACPTPPAIRYDHVSQHTPGLKPLDGKHWCDVMCDLERAWIHLPRWGLEFQVVEWLMRGYSVPTIADGLRVPWKVAHGALDEASEAMARRLGWEE